MRYCETCYKFIIFTNIKTIIQFLKIKTNIIIIININIKHNKLLTEYFKTSLRNRNSTIYKLKQK